jgi:hypothetical protein
MVFNNLTQGMQALLDSMEDMGISVPAKYQAYADMIANAPYLREGEPFPVSFYDPLKTLWTDVDVQKAWERGNEAALPEKCVLHYPRASSWSTCINFDQSSLFFLRPRSIFRSSLSATHARHCPLPSTYDRYRRIDVPAPEPRDDYGRCQWPEIRAPEVDPLFPGRYLHSFRGQFEWV